MGASTRSSSMPGSSRVTGYILRLRYSPGSVLGSRPSVAAGAARHGGGMLGWGGAGQALGQEGKTGQQALVVPVQPAAVAANTLLRPPIRGKAVL